MASVDRVGRHFPLTIAASLPCAPATGNEITELWQWLSAIEAVALAALDFDHGIERLDAQLAALPVPLPVPACPGVRAAVMQEPWVVQSPATLASALARTFAPVWQTEVYGMSMWTSAQAAPDDAHDPQDPSPRPFTIWPVYGLPDTALFTTMLRDFGS
jgi:type VI secretion system protein ImpM